MPEISRFFRIVITMYFADHEPPHFHARYGDRRMRVAIEDASILSGDFPKRARDLVLEWLELHRDELLVDWMLTRDRKSPKKIAPLE